MWLRFYTFVLFICVSYMLISYGAMHTFVFSMIQSISIQYNATGTPEFNDKN